MKYEKEKNNLKTGLTLTKDKVVHVCTQEWLNTPRGGTQNFSAPL